MASNWEIFSCSEQELDPDATLKGKLFHEFYSLSLKQINFW